MITFKEQGDLLIAVYTTRSESIEWLITKFNAGESYSFQKTFNFSRQNLVDNAFLEEPDIEDSALNLFGNPDPVEFKFAERVGNYFKVFMGILTDKFEVFISTDVEIDTDLFLNDFDISIFPVIENLITDDVYIGGEHPGAVPIDLYHQMIGQFPNAYEKKLYAEARVTSVIKEFFPSTKKKEVRLQKYLNKKVTLKGDNLLKTFQENELVKYQTIYEKLGNMLENENGYSEMQWQHEILEIILLLYPKYIKVFPEVPIKDDNNKAKFLDFLLVDAGGNIDIIEIKKPFDNVIVTEGLYRDNHIPVRELSGTVMQIEKYIYYLNRWSSRGERYLTEKYNDELPEDFRINITNPGAIIIMGRDSNLSHEQKMDFEVIKRKYKNVIDIITYDNLLQRLHFTIEQIQKV
ncbi:MAG: DUF4263 domain-containing protein [Sediminibacterium sp.]|nr:DUF4263 domain-containing protein [Sediminibacterium sp.]